MEGEKNSSGDLMASSKVVAEAAKSAYEKKSVDAIDKEKVAAASADLLDSAAKYGKLEDKPVGQYLEKAEGYLKQYSSGGTEKEKTDAPPAAADAPKPDAGEAPKEPAPAAEEEKSSDGFGLDDVMKGAASLSGKKGDGEESGGGGGGFMKMAQGFMK